MVIEDNNSKYRSIAGHLNGQGIPAHDIIRAKNMTDFAAGLSGDIGLFIIDFMLPNIDNGPALQNGRAILETIVKSGKDDALLIAISSYPEDFTALRPFYEARGCILSNYKDKKSWQSTLNHLLIQLKRNLSFDFLIFCALQEERNPYVVSFDGENVVRSGIDCFDITIGAKKGSVILLPQMGLVNAAITAAVCIDRFRPQVVGMSGICGGFEDRVSMGQLIVSSMSYEYQSGKWAADGFKQEPYQVVTDHAVLSELKGLVNSVGLLAKLESGYTGKNRPNTITKPEIAVFTSGSAVIANSDRMLEVAAHHRKVGGLDMEIFAIHRAAELSSHSPPCICAKTVVDLCNPLKDDDLHLYGSYISSKFIIKAFEQFFDGRA
jgi:nucleoside phosphorylase